MSLAIAACFWRFAGSGFDPRCQIVEVMVPTAVYGCVILVPYIAFPDARVDKTERRTALLLR